MAHVFSSDFGNVNSSSVVTSLDTAIEETTQFSNVIELFRTTTTKNLVGPGYNSVRNKMSLYQDSLSKVAQISTNLKSNILAANNFLLFAMKGYDELNTADLDEINQRIDRSRKLLAILNSEVYYYKKDEKGNYVHDSSGKRIIIGSSKVGSQSQIDAMDGLIRQLEELKEVLDKLEGNAASARGMLDASCSDSSALSTAVNGITASVYK